MSGCLQGHNIELKCHLVGSCIKRDLKYKELDKYIGLLVARCEGGGASTRH